MGTMHELIILELKYLIQNINIYIYAHTNFQEYTYLDIEDTYASDHNKTVFPVFLVYFPPFEQPPKLRKNG